jgi:2-amino-4-hydroxy-6-hydroxymethyldihydropteridine diphosphokinase
MLNKVQCAIGIGSNIDPQKHIKTAIKALREAFGTIQLSSAYASQAVLFEGYDFINLVALINTSLTVEELIKKIKSIEQKIDPHNHRLKNRKIDLDLLLYGDQNLPQHNLPREDIKKFSFTACPLAELLPNKKHPTDKIPYTELCQQLKGNPIITKTPCPL